MPLLLLLPRMGDTLRPRVRPRERSLVSSHRRVRQPRPGVRLSIARRGSRHAGAYVAATCQKRAWRSQSGRRSSMENAGTRSGPSTRLFDGRNPSTQTRHDVHAYTMPLPRRRPRLPTPQFSSPQDGLPSETRTCERVPTVVPPGTTRLPALAPRFPTQHAWFANAPCLGAKMRAALRAARLPSPIARPKGLDFRRSTSGAPLRAFPPARHDFHFS